MRHPANCREQGLRLLVGRHSNGRPAHRLPVLRADVRETWTVPHTGRPATHKASRRGFTSLLTARRAAEVADPLLNPTPPRCLRGAALPNQPCDRRMFP